MMKDRSKLIEVLVSFGLTGRAVILLFIFTAVFIAGMGCFILNMYKENIHNIYMILVFIPVMLLNLFLGFLVLNKKSQRSFVVETKIHKEERGKELNLKRTIFERKAYIVMACQGSLVAIGVLLIVIALVFGFEKFLFEIFAGYVFVGVPIGYCVLIPIFHKILD